MSIAVSHTQSPRHLPHGAPPQTGPRRRVRQEARDALAVVAFSAGASTLLAIAITLLVTMVG